MQIPSYQSNAGNFPPPKSIVKGETLYVIHHTLSAEVREYAKKLERQGFVCYASREIPAGTKNSGLINLAYTYIRDDMHIFIFFAAAFHRATISVSAPAALPPVTVTEYQKRTPATITQCSVHGGMSYLVQNHDGSFMLMDGGEYDEKDRDDLYSLLKEKTPEGKKPRIALWIFSHSDFDHVHLATSFMKKYSDKVIIDAVAHHFPDPETTSYSYQNTDEVNGNAITLLNTVEQYCPDAAICLMHTGQTFSFPGVEIEILWTADQAIPHDFIAANYTSAAWRLRFDSGKTALFLGDCMYDSCRDLAHIYDDYMKSDMLQVAHHGLTGGDKGLYQLVDPLVCLWPTTASRFNGTYERYKYQWCLGEGECDYNAWIRDDSIRKREHYPMGETITITCE